MMSRYFVIFALILIFPSGSIGLRARYGRDYVVAELIHRDSPISPFYNSSKTTSEYLREAAMRSVSRINIFNSSLHFGEKGIVSQMNPNIDDYFMKIYIGFKERLVMASTGSDFTWIQCEPCENFYEQDVLPFNVTSENSYEEIHFDDSQECKDLRNNRRHTSSGFSPVGETLRGDMCEYFYSYKREKLELETKGILSRADFHLDASNNEGVKIFPLLFGCCHQTRGIFDSRVQGMAGLGHGEFSLISQLEKKLKIAKRFSYCLLPIATNRSTKLIFGKEAKFSRGKIDSIPFRTKENSPYYHLTLRHVSVEGKNTRALQNRDNMIIDSGIAVTSLELTLFNEVSISVQKIFEAPMLEEDRLNRPFDVCYRKEDILYTLTPEIILYFDGGAVTLNPGNTFKDFDHETICMMIVPTSNADHVGVLGNWAQVNFQVEYNLVDRRINFALTDCTKFEI